MEGWEQYSQEEYKQDPIEPIETPKDLQIPEPEPWEQWQDTTQNINQRSDEGSLTEMLLPSAYKQYQDMKEAGYKSSSAFKDNGSLLLKGAMDILDIPKRGLGVISGQGEMTDPESNIWNFARQPFRAGIDIAKRKAEFKAEEMREKYKDGHWTDALSNSDPDKYLLDPRQPASGLDAYRNAGDMFFETIGDPFVIKGLLKSLFSKIGKTALKGVPKESLKQGGFQFTPSQVADKVSGTGVRLEKTAQMNPFTESITEGIKQSNVDNLQRRLTDANKAQGGDVLGEISRTKRGKRIAEVAEQNQNISKNLFEKGEDVVTQPIQNKSILGQTIIETTEKKGKGLGANLMPIVETTTKKSFKSDAVKNLDKYIESTGHKLGSEVKNVGSISDKTIKQALKYRADVNDARSIKDLINVKRNIAQETFDASDMGLFKGDKNQAFLKGINKQLNDEIAKSISKVAKSDDIAEAYRSINKQYSDNIDLMSPITKKLGLGKKNTQIQNVTQKIKTIGVDQLDALKNGGIETRAIYDELSRGAFEDVIKQSIDPKTLMATPDRFRTAWGKLDKGIKDVLFDDKLIKESNDIYKSLGIADRGDILKANPSGTAKMNMLAKVSTNKTEAVMSALRYLAVKHYYKTGELYRESAINLFINANKKAGQILDNKWVDRALKAETLSNFLKPELKETKEK